ncbi:MAG: hypothetical protein EBV03_06190 [Proteobacteria bacterium]|nr:hypothetical protein [Pseudomonadota bacterium]
MATDKPQEWTTRTPGKGDRPRVLFENRMVVFATGELRDELLPESKLNNGFSSMNEAIFAAGPRDLRPENHNHLKKQLAAAIVKARAKPISPTQQELLQSRIINATSTELLEKHGDIIAQHFAAENEIIRQEFGTPDKLEALKNQRISIFELKKHIANHMDVAQNSRELYDRLRSICEQHGLGKEADALEHSAARFVVNHWLSYDRIHDEAARTAIIDRCVKMRPEGTRHVAVLDTQELQAIRQEKIDATYAKLDTVIKDARQRLALSSHVMKIHKPFEHTKEEKQQIMEIHDMANRDVVGKPLVLAGYQNPALTIFVENKTGINYAGISYEGQDMIRVSTHAENTNFYSTLVEELMHQGMDKIYNNNSLPYRNHADTRRELLVRAIKRDEKEETGDVFPRLGLSATSSYNVHNEGSMHKEVPVKLLKMMAAPSQPNHVQDFPALEEFTRKVVLGDAVAHMVGRPLADIGMDYTRSPPPATGPGAGGVKPGRR